MESLENIMNDNKSEELNNSEIIIALAYAVGTDNYSVIKIIEDELKEYDYETEVIKISKELIEPCISPEELENVSAYERVDLLMDYGNKIRRDTKQNCFLASGVASIINSKRDKQKQSQKKAYIIDSLKHPEEADKLKEIYPIGFYLFVINESEESRIKYLNEIKNMGRTDAKNLIQRDVNESEDYGQHTRDVFEHADFHLSANTYDRDIDKSSLLKNQIERIIKLIFGNPFITPTFDEYAMFMAYSSGLRSADLSRQVGAVISRHTRIIATGANDVPCFGGGQYWPDENYNDKKDGRDYVRGYDSNKRELENMTNDITNKLEQLFEFPKDVDKDKVIEVTKKVIMKSSLKNLTEYGRAVHAEMSAITSCAQNGISLDGTTLYCSTFPCHNCAKHIIASGIKRVVYIEPYPKSRTLDLYSDSITISNENDKVKFEEFVGIGPRRFFDLFSLRLSTGSRVMRKSEKNGSCVKWEKATARIRCQMISTSYIDKEMFEALKWEKYKNERG